jgi:hypothetical protein
MPTVLTAEEMLLFDDRGGELWGNAGVIVV